MGEIQAVREVIQIVKTTNSKERRSASYAVHYGPSLLTLNCKKSNSKQHYAPLILRVLHFSIETSTSKLGH